MKVQRPADDHAALKHRPPLGENVGAVVRKLYRDGHTPKDIAAILRCQQQIVVGILASAQEHSPRREFHSDPQPWLPQPPRTDAVTRGAEARRAYRAGEPIDSIARRLRLSQADVTAIINSAPRNHQ
jgi:hypothetical protein